MSGASDRTADRKAWRQLRLVGMLENEPRVGPRSVHFDIANACNTRCTTCWHHSEHLQPDQRPDPAWKRRTLPLATFERVVDELVALGGLEEVLISGMGEPTLHPDLPAMVAKAHGHGFDVTLITNLLAGDPVALAASGGRLKFLGSICAASEETWQRFHAHPVPGAWDKVCGQLDRMARHGVRARHVHVITRDNVHELPAMVRQATRWPADGMHFKLASLGRGTEAVALSPAQAEALTAELIPQALAEAERLGVQTDLAAFATQVHPGQRRTAPIESVGCFMGFAYARVTVEGEVLYCCNTALGVGQLGPEMPFGRIWRSRRYQALREDLRAGRYHPGCAQCGKYKQNLAWSEKLRARLPPPVFASLLGRRQPSAAPAAGTGAP